MSGGPQIPWQPISKMPENRKDGRLILLAESSFGVGGSDGSRDEPWQLYFARWEPMAATKGRRAGRYNYEPGWQTTELDKASCLRLAEGVPTHWADINLPDHG